MNVSKYIISILSILFLSSTSFASESENSKIRLSGDLKVSGGDLNYSLAISMPKGRNNFTPMLGIDYLGDRHVGVLGMGFQLTGTSVIYRCGKNILTDGVWGGVNFNSNDRYCIDGKRLVAISGENGGNLVEYKLEENGNSKVVSYRSEDSSGPDYFKVYTKSGLVYEYGSSINSRETVDGLGTYKWLLSNQLDKSHNEISYKYENTGKGNSNLSQISYSGGSVNFSYKSRKDIRKKYFLGKEIVNDKIIDNISIYDSSNNEVGVYSLEYITSLASGSSLLSSVTYCSELSCSEPINFSWQSDKFKTKNKKIALDLYQADFFDADRDGHMDAYGIRQKKYSPCGGGSRDGGVILFPDGKTKSKVLDKYLLTGTINDPKIITNTYKYKRDGKGSYVCKSYGHDGEVRKKAYKLITSDNPILNEAYQPNGDGVWVAQTNKDKISGDFNGDGSSTLIDKKESNKERFVDDIDGDNIDDYYVNVKSQEIKLYLSSQGHKEYKIKVSNLGSKFFIKDINNDGLLDLVYLGSDKKLHAYYFNGNKFISAFTTGVIKSKGNGGVDIIDYDNDGYPELYIGGQFFHNNFGIIDTSNLLVTVNSVIDKIDYNGDGLNDLIIADKLGKLSVLINESSYSDKINKIQEFDIDYSIEYKPASDPQVLEQVRFYNFPFTNVTPAKFLVSSYVRKPKGYPSITTQYHYKGARAHIKGGGFLGFGRIEKTEIADVTTKTITTFYRSVLADNHFELGNIILNGPKKLTDISTYADGKLINGTLSESLYLYGQPITKQVYRDNHLVSSESYNYQLSYSEGYDSYYYQYYPNKTIKKNYELSNSSVKSETVTTRELDLYGNLIFEKKIVSSNIQSSAGSYTMSTMNNYLLDSMIDAEESNSDPEQFWKYGALTQIRSSITDDSTGLVSVSQKLYTYDDHGLVTSQTVYGSDEQGNLDASNYVTKDYDHDEWGNIIRRTTSGKGFKARRDTNSYDVNGLNVVSSTNAKGHTTHFSYDSQGLLIQQIDPLMSRTTSIVYDSFGRIISKILPGLENVQNYKYALGKDCPNSLATTSWCVILDASSGEQQVIHYDFSDREIRTLHTAFDGKWIAIDTAWDTNGRKLSVSRPYFLATKVAPAQVEFTYDVLNRLLTKSEPASKGTSAVFSYFYDGYETKYIDARGFTHSESSDVLGHILVKNEPLGATRTYSYYPNGKLKKSADSSGNITLVQYDSLGNRTYLNDPDLGEWNYTYNALGELTSQTDANGIKTEYQYDVLGRKISEITDKNKSIWLYDENNADGVLTSMEGNGNKTEYRYDAQGLLDDVAVTIDGETFKTNYLYDNFERLSSEVRPSTDTLANGSIDASKRLVIDYLYNENGYLSAVRSPKSFADKAFTSTEFRQEIKQLINIAIQQAESYLDQASYYDNQQKFYTSKAAEYSSQTVAITKLDAASASLLGDGYRYQSLCYENGTCHIRKQSWTMVDGPIVIPFTVDSSPRYRFTVPKSAHVNGAFESHTIHIEPMKYIEDWLELTELTAAGKPEPKLYNYYLDDYDGDGEKDLIRTVDSYSAQADEETVSALYITEKDLTEAADISSQNYRVYTDLANDLISLSEKVIQLSGVYCEKANELGGNLVNQTLRGDCVNTENTSQAEQLDLILAQSELEEALGKQAYIYYWQRRDTDAYDHTLSETLGNGLVNTYQYDLGTGRPSYFVTDRANVLYSNDGISNSKDEIRYIQYRYDKHNNVTERYDQQLGITDRWNYDALDRVTQNTIILADKTQHGVDNPDLSASFSYEYDKLGNITNKSDIGDYTYAGNQAGPHAVTQAGDIYFEYDKVGNMVRGYKKNSSDSDERVITWSEFNKPTKLVKDANTVTFDYDANHNRFAKSTSDGIKTLYLGQSYERQTDRVSGKVSHINYIYADGKLIALNSQAYDTDDQLQDKQIRYLHYGALNSVDMVTDGYGLIVERRSYDTWGKQRKIVWQDDGELSVVQDLLTTRGYTGHEEISEIGLIHMNGRVYDPLLARFTSGDPLIQDPYFTGSYNRYSYVWNNPLKYIDPTGFVSVEGAGFGGTPNDQVGGIGRSVHYGPSGRETHFDRNGRNTGSTARSYAVDSIEQRIVSEPLQAMKEAYQPPPDKYGIIVNMVIDFFNPKEEVEDFIENWESETAFAASTSLLGQFAFKRIRLFDKLEGLLSGNIIDETDVKKNVVKVEQGIYEFKDTTGKTYVGQSVNVQNRLKQHIKTGKLDPNQSVKTKEVLGGKTAREVAEHRRIQEITGGVPARFSDKISNKVDPIGPNRRHLLD